MSYSPQPPRAPPPPANKYTGNGQDSFVGNFIPLPPQPYQSQPNEGIYGPGGGSSTNYDKKRPRSQDYDGGGRGGGRMNSNSHQGRGGGRGRHNNSFESSYGGGSKGNNYGVDRQPSAPYANNNQHHGRGKSLFKPDMITDPWHQLAQKMVPQGLLDAAELESRFNPKINQEKSNFSPSVHQTDMKSNIYRGHNNSDSHDIEHMKSALLDQI